VSKCKCGEVVRTADGMGDKQCGNSAWADGLCRTHWDRTYGDESDTVRDCVSVLDDPWHRARALSQGCVWDDQSPDDWDCESRNAFRGRRQ